MEHRLIHLTAAEKRALERVAGLQASGATLNTAGQAALAQAYTPGSMTATSTNPKNYDVTVTGSPSSQLRVNPRRAEQIAGAPTINPDTLQPEYAAGSQAAQHQAAVAENQAAGSVQTRQAAPSTILGAPTAGAGGQPGALGFNPSAVSVGQDTLNFDAQIIDLKNKIADAHGRSQIDSAMWERGGGMEAPAGWKPGTNTGQRAAGEEQSYREQLANLERQKADQDAKAADEARIAEEKRQAEIKAGREKGEGATSVKQETGGTPLSMNLSDLPPALASAIDPLNRFSQTTEKNAAKTRDETIADLDQDKKDALKILESGKEDALKILKEKLDLAERSDKLTREQAKLNEQALLQTNEIAQMRIDLDSQYQISNQRKQNIQTELENRRYAARTGINMDSGGLEWMHREVQKGVDAINYIAQSASLGSLDLLGKRSAIIKQYDLDMKTADYNADVSYQNAYTDFGNEMKSLKSDYGATAKDVREGKKKAREDYATRVFEADKIRAQGYKDAYMKVYDMEIEVKKQENIDKRADIRMRFQESQADKRMQMTIDNQNRQQMNADKTRENQSADDVRSLKSNVMQQPDVKTYLTLKSSLASMQPLLDELVTTKDPNKIGAIKELTMTLIAKAADPTTGVREGEITKFGKNQTWVQRVKAANNAIFGGDMTGLTKEAIGAYSELLKLQVNEQNANAVSQFAPIIGAIVTHNNRAQYFPLNPVDILPPELLQDAADAFNSYTSAESRIGEGYNFEWDNKPVSTEDSYGLFQINMDPSYAEGRRKNLGLQNNEELYNPEVNINAAYQISGGGKDWTPWTTYTSGTYQKYLGFNTQGKMGEQEANVLKNQLQYAGFSGKSLEEAFAIIMAESGGRPTARYNPSSINSNA